MLEEVWQAVWEHLWECALCFCLLISRRRFQQLFELRQSFEPNVQPQRAKVPQSLFCDLSSVFLSYSYPFFSFIYYFLNYLFIYRAVPSLSCGTWDLQSLLGLAGSLVGAHRIQFPDQGSNPGPLHWEWRVFATGTPGKSLIHIIIIKFDSPLSLSIYIIKDIHNSILISTLFYSKKLPCHLEKTP